MNHLALTKSSFAFVLSGSKISTKIMLRINKNLGINKKKINNYIEIVILPASNFS